MQFNAMPPILDLPEPEWRLLCASHWPYQASQQFAIPLGTFTDNSPGAGSVAWEKVIVEYSGNQYTITDGNTSDKWIYWELATPTVFAHSATFPTTSSDSILIGANTTGTFRNAWKSGQGVNAEAVVGTLVAAQIAADAITADKIDVAQLSAISADLGTITAGTVTGATLQTTATASRGVKITTSDGIIIYDTSGNVVFKTGTSGFITFRLFYSQPSTSVDIMLDNSLGPEPLFAIRNYSGDSLLSVGNLIDIEAANNINLASGKVLKVNGTQVVGAQQAAIADATDAATTMARLNDLLAACRAHGIIDT